MGERPAAPSSASSTSALLEPGAEVDIASDDGVRDLGLGDLRGLIPSIPAAVEAAVARCFFQRRGWCSGRRPERRDVGCGVSAPCVGGSSKAPAKRPLERGVDGEPRRTGGDAIGIEEGGAGSVKSSDVWRPRRAGGVGRATNEGASGGLVDGGGGSARSGGIDARPSSSSSSSSSATVAFGTMREQPRKSWRLDVSTSLPSVYGSSGIVLPVSSE